MNKADQYESFVNNISDYGLARVPTVKILFHLRQPRYYSLIHEELNVCRSSVKEFLINHPSWYVKIENEVRDHTKTGRRLRTQYVLSKVGHRIIDELIDS